MRMMLVLAAAVAAGLLAGSRWTDTGPALHVDADPQSPTYGSVTVRGLEPRALARLSRAGLRLSEWEALFAVYTASDTSAVPPLLGRYDVERDAIRFTPRFPLRPGLAHRVRFDPRALPGAGGSGEVVEARFTPPASTGAPSTTVTAVYPTAGIVPANLLKFYVHFSAPMGTSDALAHVRLLDEAGQPVDGAFLALEDGLWDPSRTRLTLLLDPGRIKRGIGSNADRGLPLEAGRRYRLAVDAGWRDASGRPLVRAFEKAFRAAGVDRASPAPMGTWPLDQPAAGTTGALVVHLPEPLDHALLQRLLHVEDAAGRRVAGHAEAGPGEDEWRFTPAAPWTTGRYTLHADPLLEDLAGNSLYRPFDLDLRAAPPATRPTVRPFHAAPPSDAL